jgi:hypothetical protein
MKKTTLYLIALVAMMITSLGSMAQGGLAPLVNSTHNYTVSAGSGNKAWTVSPASGNTIISGASTASVNIKWTAAGTYTLQFTETNLTTLCSTVKTTTVVVALNTFDVSATSPSATCNAANGQANYVGSTATTSIAFKVDMTTSNTSWSPNWEFTFTLTPSSGATIANVKAGSTSLTPVTGTYTASGLTSSSGDGTVNITMDITGNIYSLHTVGLAITSAKELQYSTPDVDSNDWTATQTINAVPNTSSISTD